MERLFALSHALPTGTRALCNRCPASTDNITFLFSRLKIKSCCPRGGGQTEPIPARVLSVGFRQEAASWQREAWGPEPTPQGKQNRKLEMAAYRKVSLSSQTNANHCLPCFWPLLVLERHRGRIGVKPSFVRFLLFAEEEMWLVRPKQYLPWSGLPVLTSGYVN